MCVSLLGSCFAATLDADVRGIGGSGYLFVCFPSLVFISSHLPPFPQSYLSVCLCLSHLLPLPAITSSPFHQSYLPVCQCHLLPLLSITSHFPTIIPFCSSVCLTSCPYQQPPHHTFLSLIFPLRAVNFLLKSYLSSLLLPTQHTTSSFLLPHHLSLMHSANIFLPLLVSHHAQLSLQLITFTSPHLA